MLRFLFIVFNNQLLYKNLKVVLSEKKGSISKKKYISRLYKLHQWKKSVPHEKEVRGLLLIMSLLPSCILVLNTELQPFT